ncbi:MAG: hypothetical protein ACTHL7_15430, partial [Steroidobacteraceae bacterium]
MVRTLFLGFLLLAAVRGAAADEAATTASSTPALAANTPATTPSVDATKRRAKKPATSATAGDAKSDAGAESREAAPPGGDVKMSGMSILGNEDAPKSLVIVPWKSSQLADMPSV